MVKHFLAHGNTLLACPR